MTQQRMAGSDQFKKDVNKAAEPKGGGRSHMNSAPQLIGADAWDRQVQRENQQSNNDAVTGSYGAKNMAEYINVSKSATQGNGNFSLDAGNKWTNNSREQSNVNKEQNKGFSDNRINNNVNYANAQQDRNLKKNEGFALNTTNNFVNNAKDHREDNTRKAQQFANNTVSKYMDMNKNNQSISVAKLDQGIRQAPMYDEAKSKVTGLSTFGDMYRYGREALPGWNLPDPMKGVEKPDLEKIGDKYSGKIEDMKI